MAQVSLKDYLTTPYSYLQLPHASIAPGRSTVLPQGPYTTGCLDLLKGRDTDGSLIRLYYPTDETDIRNQPIKKWTLWHQDQETSWGFAVFMTSFMPNIPYALLYIIRYIYSKIIQFLLRDVLLPAIWEAPITDKKEPLPILVFSHGLNANRSVYSNICNDMASYGFLVAAVEHRDESSAATFTLSSKGKKRWITIKPILRHENECEIRKEQVEIRARECSRALDILKSLNEGHPIENLLESSFDLKSLKGKLDLSKPGIAGQSFGGATVIEALGRDKRFHYGIALDPWMFPIIFNMKSLAKNIDQPILFVMLEKFQDKENMKCLKLFQNRKNEFYTIRGAVHQHQVDTGMVFSKDWVILQKFADTYSSSFTPEVPLTINNALMLRFIFENLDQNSGFRKALEVFLKSEEKNVSEGIYGTAKIMLGWASSKVNADSLLSDPGTE